MTVVLKHINVAPFTDYIVYCIDSNRVGSCGKELGSTIGSKALSRVGFVGDCNKPIVYRFSTLSDSPILLVAFSIYVYCVHATLQYIVLLEQVQARMSKRLVLFGGLFLFSFFLLLCCSFLLFSFKVCGVT
jgi:hypothetical protein